MYWRFPTAVVYDEDPAVRFPAVTLCFPEGYNRTRLVGEHDLDPDAETSEDLLKSKEDVLKVLINYSYRPDELILDCLMKTTSDLCSDFSCKELWNIRYTYTLHTSCYTVDLTSTNGSRINPFQDCVEPWKYTMQVKTRTSPRSENDQTAAVMALIHEPGTFSGGLPKTVMMSGNKQYIIATVQSDTVTLPSPYETACTDYTIQVNSTVVKSAKTQEMECEESCIQSIWRDLCHCISSTYMMRHTSDVHVCTTVERFKCREDIVKSERMRTCRTTCGRSCESTIYKARAFVNNFERRTSGIIEFSLRHGVYKRHIVRSHPMLSCVTCVTCTERLLARTQHFTFHAGRHPFFIPGRSHWDVAGIHPLFFGGGPLRRVRANQKFTKQAHQRKSKQTKKPCKGWRPKGAMAGGAAAVRTARAP
ncbi:uncharacterized protein LOC135369782 [Ornithodoros turicata]|uniref:uncharacterized protein LOC135369782 n=1 Tax=Ornithodoros turicata TaxID=34597 RepID=UPI0031393A2E